MGDSKLLELAFQLLVNGMSSGSLYALGGVSFAIIYNTAKTFHYSHSLIFSIAGYMTVLCATNMNLPLGISFIITVVVSAFLGCAIEAGLYRRLRKIGARLFTIFLSSLGVATIGFSLLLLVFTANPLVITSSIKVPIQIGTLNFIKFDIVIVVLSWTLIGLLVVFLARNKLGKAIRAVGINTEMAEISGVNVNMIYLLVYAIGSALFGAQAFLYSVKFAVTPFMGFNPFVYAFTAVFLGGVGSIPGAAFGGLIIGLSEQMGMLLVPGEYRIMIAFSILFIVILFRPQGILGVSRHV